MNDTKPTILVVDDEKTNRALLAEVLQTDYTVILAKDGQQALERAREHLPDLILLDVLMPEMSGHEVIRLLKQDDKLRQIPVIFISALDSAADETLGLELGAADYITKPFHVAIVRMRVRNHLQLVHQRRLLEQLALIDALTEIANRRRFEQVLEQEWARCMRTNVPLSLVMVDVDYFKRYNDYYGHAAGDAVLRHVAHTLATTARRAGDLVARYGGEEFVMILPGTDAAAARLLTEQACAAIGNLAIPHAGSEAGDHVTVSIGGATAVPAIGDLAPPLLSRADAALYAVKAAGRNHVQWSD